MLLSPYPPPATPPATGPTFDNSAAGGNATSGNTSVSHNIGASANLLVALVATYTHATPTVTVAGNTMTDQGAILNNNVASNGGLDVFTLALTPGALAGTQTVAMTSGGSTSALATMTFSNVKNVGGLQTSNGSSTSWNQAIAASSGIIVHGFTAFILFGGQSTLASYTGVTPVYDQGFGSMLILAAGYAAAAGDVTVAGSYGSAAAYAGGGLFLS